MLTTWFLWAKSLHSIDAQLRHVQLTLKMFNVTIHVVCGRLWYYGDVSFFFSFLLIIPSLLRHSTCLSWFFYVIFVLRLRVYTTFIFHFHIFEHLCNAHLHFVEIRVFLIRSVIEMASTVKIVQYIYKHKSFSILLSAIIAFNKAGLMT